MLKFLKKLFKPIDRYFVSEADKFMAKFDEEQQWKKSASQSKEIAKHKRIAYLRDNVVDKKNANEIDSFLNP